MVEYTMSMRLPDLTKAHVEIDRGLRRGVLTADVLRVDEVAELDGGPCRDVSTADVLLVHEAIDIARLYRGVPVADVPQSR